VIGPMVNLSKVPTPSKLHTVCSMSYTEASILHQAILETT